MQQAQTSTARSHGRLSGTMLLAASLVGAMSLNGCADLSGQTASNTPYKVAGPMVAKGAPQDTQGCVADVNSFVDVCNGFPRYLGP